MSTVTEHDIRAAYVQHYRAPIGREHMRISTSQKGNWVVRHYDVVAFRGDVLIRTAIYSPIGEFIKSEP